MKKNKKWLGITVAVLALLFIIGACTPEAEGPDEDTTAEEVNEKKALACPDI